MADKAITGKPWRVARKIYGAAFLFGLAFVAIVALIVDLASREADFHALRSDQAKLGYELQRVREQTAVEFADFTYWDDAVANIATATPSLDFVRREIVEDGASELGYGWMAAVAPDDSVTFAVNGEQILARPQDLAFARKNKDLVAAARHIYREKRLKVANGRYMLVGLSAGQAGGAEAMAWRLVDGVPSLIIAQVIIPETEAQAIRDGEEYVFLAQKPFTPQMISNLAIRMEFMAAAIEPVANAGRHTAMALFDDAAEPSIALLWKPLAPRMKIIGSVMPFAVALLAMLGAALVFSVQRYSRLIDRLEMSEAENRRLANHDRLTGLPNRTFFDAHVESLAAKTGAQPFALISIDLDRFKAVNDTFGHPAGDTVLVEVSARFQRIIGDRGMVARMGGDEFVAAISQGTDKDALQSLCDELVVAAGAPVAWGPEQLRIGASVGVALWPGEGRTIRELMAAADRNLYKAKSEGRGRTVFALQEQLAKAGFKAA
ncbi:MAG: diguanylate cyclase [Rhizobiaceae bacterium]